MTGDGDESPTQTRCIEVDAQTYERFEEFRKQTRSEGAPPMLQTTYINALLDTEKAVQEGFYDD